MKTIPVVKGALNLIRAGDWNTWTPGDALNPVFSRDGNTLRIAGGGNRYCFGRWQKRVPVEGGKAYRFTLQFRWQAMDDPHLHILNAICWCVDGRPEGQCPQDAVMNWRRKGKWVVANEVLVAPPKATHAVFHLYLRYATKSTVWWREVALEPAQVPSPRIVKVATVQCGKTGNLGVWRSFLDQAGQARVDLVLLPEAINLRGTIRDCAEPMQGPAVRLFSSKARQYHMNVCGSLYERDGAFIFNTAVLFDRRGRLIGKYRKVHPYWPEETEGCCPGNELPVFNTDVGRVGIMICYDSWRPETARLLALKGAEIILFPNAGYEPKIMPARAIDNGVYLVIASWGGPAAILNPLGAPLVETRVEQMVTATCDVNYRPHPHPNAGGVLNGSPAGHRATRNALDSRLHHELLAEATRWEGYAR